MQEEQDRFIQVERFIPGTEFAVEGMLTHGATAGARHLRQARRRWTGPFFEETIYVTPSRAPHATQDQLVASMRMAVRALGLTHGPVHAEMRVHGNSVWVLEVGGAADRRHLFARRCASPAAFRSKS